MAALVTPAASLVSKLMLQGRQSAAVLEALLQDASPHEHAGIREIAAEILRCCDRAIAAFHGSGDVAAVVDDGAVGGRKRKSSGPAGAATQSRPKRRTRARGGETPAKRVEKRWTSEDGFIWRKYGQKEILHSKHPRLYFRCSYRDDSGCPATRQVQQSEEDPSLYVITYFGDHTCCADIAADAAAATASGFGDGEKQPFVINFGSATASEGSPAWHSSSSHDDDVRNETSRSSQGVRSPEEEGAVELRVKEAKVEPASSDLQPTEELSSSANASCSSPYGTLWPPAPTGITSARAPSISLASSSILMTLFCTNS